MPLPRSVLLPFLVAVLLSTSASPPQPCRATAHGNITDILLAVRGDLAEFSRALAATGLADRIVNSRDGAVTVLAVDDAHMAPLGASGLPREALRLALSRHVLAGHYDDARLRRLLLPGAADIVAPALEDAPSGSPATAGAVRIARERRSGRVAFAPLHDDARAATTVFYVGPVHVDAAPGGSVSVLLVSGVMWSPAAAPPPVSKLNPSSTAAPAAGRGPSRAGVPRVVVSPNDLALRGSATVSTPRGERVASAPWQAATDGSRAAEVPGHEGTPPHVSATEERGVSFSSTAPAPGPPEHVGVRRRQKVSGWFVFDIIVVALFIFGLICCCRCRCSGN